MSAQGSVKQLRSWGGTQRASEEKASTAKVGVSKLRNVHQFKTGIFTLLRMKTAGRMKTAETAKKVFAHAVSVQMKRKPAFEKVFTRARGVALESFHSVQRGCIGTQTTRERRDPLPPWGGGRRALRAFPHSFIQQFLPRRERIHPHWIFPPWCQLVQSNIGISL